MPRRDPMEVLALVRALARGAARRDMATAQAVLATTTAAAQRAAVALEREAGATGADYAAWLPAAQRARQRAEEGMRRAEAGAELARRALVAARADAEAVERLLQARRAARRTALLAAEQAALDDIRRG
jgi:flagellar export protein FliJ